MPTTAVFFTTVICLIMSLLFIVVHRNNSSTTRTCARTPSVTSAHHTHKHDHNLRVQCGAVLRYKLTGERGSKKRRDAVNSRPARLPAKLAALKITSPRTQATTMKVGSVQAQCHLLITAPATRQQQQPSITSIQLLLLMVRILCCST